MSVINLASVINYWTPAVFKNIKENGVFRNDIFTEKLTTVFTVFNDLIQESIMENGLFFIPTKPMKTLLNMGGFSIENMKWKSLQNSPLTNGIFRSTCQSVSTSTKSVKLFVNDVELSIPPKSDTSCTMTITKNVNTINLEVSSKIDFDGFVGKIVYLQMADFNIPKTMGLPTSVLYGFGYVTESTGPNARIVPCTLEVSGGNANMKINLTEIKENTIDLYMYSSTFVTSTVTPF
ncbi:hypothetical protein AL387_gp130 [Salmon gill poxvirus]|uniref:Uncharacterized protein n=1 Tax=Salmon gill poxvirus TaxID=1680908 RepID=A0A0H4YFM6_9POXV|nr:hypothetical protein AL387_gp130 [Salmon gill poxvirus]AKR04254.1 hypothetical protein SGPV130 [Salmon gill poxvirus]